MINILIAGTGGLANELVSWASGIFNVVGYTTHTESIEDDFGLPGIRFSDKEVTPGLAGTEYIFFAIGSPQVRKKLYNLYQNKGFKFPNLIHPTSTIASSAILSEGVIIGPQCVISPNVRIGVMSYINFQCGIGHDSNIGDFVQINPGSQLGGFSKVGDGTLIGSGSTVLQGVTLGTKVTVASGSVIFAKVADNSTVMGNPAKRMRAFER